MTTDSRNRAFVFQEEQYDHSKVIITPVTPIPQVNVLDATGARFEINLGDVQSGMKRKRSHLNVKNSVLQPKQIQVQKQKRFRSLQAEKQPSPKQNAYSFGDGSVSKDISVNQSIMSNQMEVDYIKKVQKQMSAAKSSQIKSKKGRKDSFSVISEKKSIVTVRKINENIKPESKLPAPRPISPKFQEVKIDNKSSNVNQNKSNINLQEVSQSLESDIIQTKGLARKRRRVKNVQIGNSLQQGQDSSMIVLEKIKEPIQVDDVQNQVNFKQLREIEVAMTCPPPHRLWRCNVIIDKSSCSYPIFSLRKKDQTFLVNAQKQFFHMHSYYQISAHEKFFKTSGRSHLGSLRSNFTGTEFNLYQQKNGESELACTICYKAEFSCFATFRNIQVYIRDPQLPYQQLHGASDNSLNLKELYQYEQNVVSKKIIRLVNKKPDWNQKHQVYIMNLKGRAKMASVKNMALIDEQNPQKYIMLFCKTDIDNYHLQMVWPLSPFITLGVLLSSFDFKLCCQ